MIFESLIRVAIAVGVLISFALVGMFLMLALDAKSERERNAERDSEEN